jgi:hypothetical protein
MGPVISLQDHRHAVADAATWMQASVIAIE